MKKPWISYLILAICMSLCLIGHIALAEEVISADDKVLERNKTLRELDDLEAAINLNDQQRIALKKEISDLDKDRISINRELIETSKKSRSLEQRIAKASDRLIELRGEEGKVRSFLNSKRSLLSEVLAALQRMGRNPPPALLVTPEDALSSVRSAILLGAVVPQIREEADELLSQLQKLQLVTNQINQQRAGLNENLASLASEEERLNLLLAEKKKLSGRAQSQLAEEYAKSVELASRATSLKELIGQLETQIDGAREAAEAARKAEERLATLEAARKETNEKYKSEEAFSDISRQSPAISFEQAKGLLPLPATGLMVTTFGEKDELGEEVVGLNLQTRENARIVSPVDGWIMYAGPFRTYGQLLIVNAGNDYHVVLSGLDSVDVSVGQFVIVGEPVGKMGAKRVASARNVDLSLTKPILYVEFRKDGTPIDPTAWWSDQNIQRVTNGS